jgi:hypothetical protein
MVVRTMRAKRIFIVEEQGVCQGFGELGDVLGTAQNEP